MCVCVCVCIRESDHTRSSTERREAAQRLQLFSHLTENLRELSLQLRASSSVLAQNQHLTASIPADTTAGTPEVLRVK